MGIIIELFMSYLKSHTVLFWLQCFEIPIPADSPRDLKTFDFPLAAALPAT